MRVRHRTIMFTDISGYTDLSQRIGHEALEQLLAEYETIVRHEAETNHGGRVVKNIGDSFLVVYDSARDALRAAAAIQRAIAGRNTRVPAARTIAVKIAVNAGDVIVDESGDVFGDPVNVCARMEKVATGGETLFSEAIYHSMHKAEVSFEEFGHYNFKGVDHPVTLRAEHGGPFRAALELARRAPSAKNKQSWRVVVDRERSRLDIYAAFRLRDEVGVGRKMYACPPEYLDLGAFIRSLEIGLEADGLCGRLVIDEPGLAFPPGADLEYIATYVRN